MPGRLVRLNRLLAERGAASRRHADDLIRGGLVRVDGEIVREVGAKADADASIEVEGRSLERGPRVYLVLNKPKGVVCTNAPGEKRPRAVDLVRARGGTRLFCVGRLDLESSGLLLLTNDGAFADRVLHPRYGVPRTYWVRVKGKIAGEALRKIENGVWLSEGRAGRSRVLVRRRFRDSSVLLVTLREGKNREVRRAFAKVGHPVIDLARTRIGPVTIRGLRPGAARPLTRPEIDGLLHAAPERGTRRVR